MGCGGEQFIPTPNKLPIAVVEETQQVEIGTLVTLNGSASNDDDGDKLSYLWSLNVPPNSQSTLENNTSAIVHFIPDVDGEYIVELIVNDGIDNSLFDSIEVSVITPTKIAFIGGSITVGTGSTPGNSWALLTKEWLEQYYENGIEYKNIALGGSTSGFGVYRLNRDLDNFIPDVAFIEYVMNDTINSDYIYTNIDALVYKLRVKNPDVIIVYVATTGSRQKSLRIKNIEPKSVRLAREISEYNNVFFIDVGAALWREIIINEVGSIEYLPDGVHPNDAGYAVYFQEVKDQLTQYLPIAEGARVADSYLHGSGLGEATIIAKDAITDTDCQLNDNHLVCDQGQRFSYTFYGANIGLTFDITSDGGQMDCLLDSNESIVINFWDKYTQKRSRPHGKLLFTNQSMENHVLNCQVNDVLLDNPEVSSTGHMAYISGLMVSHIDNK